MNIDSGSYKECDTRNNWVMMMFVSHKRKNVFRKESTQVACETGLRECEQYGFKFSKIGFGDTHMHFSVDIPQRYSVMQAKIMLKRSSAARIFKEKPNFLKLYPDRHFWSGYEHHESIGIEREKADRYIENQEKHHNIAVVRDMQLLAFQRAASGDTAPL